VPRRKWFFTYLGRRTAYVYVLHLFFINLFTLLELFPKELGWSIYLALPVVWLAIVFLVSSTPVVFLAKPIVEGKITVPALREWSFGIKLFGHSGNLADKK
jgi:fucose 4-O-acetylase-like acetyltransferase